MNARLIVALALLAACGPKPAPIPGGTAIEVSSVAIQARGGARLDVDYGPLYASLGLQADGRFNPFVLAEDGRRVASYLQNAGYFDAQVDAPELAYTPARDRVAVTWRVREGAAYTVASVQIVGAPRDQEAAVRTLIPFAAGDRVDLATYRGVRNQLAQRLRDAGHAHARGYSRTFVDRTAKTVAWFYYLDVGPKTRVRSVAVEGNHRVPADAIAARSGLRPGRGYSPAEKRRAELALVDSGSFVSATILSDADDAGPPEYPDRGGSMTAEQVDADGNFAPRTLSADLPLRVSVVEAPARQLRAELGLEADPSRVDAYAGARVTLRDLFAPLQHVVVEGRVGYGWLVEERDPVRGLYGDARVQYLIPGFLHRDLDLRLGGRWRDVLYPSAMLRELTAGPELRGVLAPGVFLEGGVRYRLGRQIGLPAIDPASAAALDLATSDASAGAELVASFVADRRDDRVEPTDGWLLAASASYSPGGPLGDHRWLQATGEGRAFRPLTKAWSLGGRASAGAVGLGDDDGIPLGPRLFGGGAYGMRGFARDHLSPSACAAAAMDCDVLVGGRSLVESSLEVRYLPPFAVYGGGAFVDAGAAGAGLDPFASGISVAVGLGGRFRSWYLPIAIDVGYRVVDENRVGAALDRLLVFFRVGEAF